MRLKKLLVIIFCFSVTASIGQATLQASEKLIVASGSTHAEIATTEWGSSHGIFFGSKIQYTGTDHLWANGNAVYASDQGPYNFGAFSLGYIANGGTFGFYDGGSSTGANNPISWQAVMAFPRGGNVGIGTTNPLARLHVDGDVKVNTYVRAGAMPTSPNAQFRILGQEGIGALDPANNRTTYLWASGETYGISAYDYGLSAPLPLTVNFENTNTYINSNGGQVVIGSHSVLPAGYKLGVDGNIIAQKIKVQQTPWADYVFDPGYELLELKEVESFIRTHRHLPGVRSAKEVEQYGLDLGDSQAELLKKIEELTLYAIDQEKRLAAFEERERVRQEQLAIQQRKQEAQQLELDLLRNELSEFLKTNIKRE